MFKNKDVGKLRKKFIYQRIFPFLPCHFPLCQSSKTYSFEFPDSTKYATNDIRTSFFHTLLRWPHHLYTSLLLVTFLCHGKQGWL